MRLFLCAMLAHIIAFMFGILWCISLTRSVRIIRKLKGAKNHVHTPSRRRNRTTTIRETS